MAKVFNKNQLIILICMYAGYGAMMICRQTIPIISAVMIDDPELGLTKSDYGAIIGLGAGGALLGKLIWGPLSDLLGGRITFLLGLLLSALLIGAFGISPTVGLFSGLVFALYCAKSAGWPAIAKLIGNWYAPHKYGRVWGVLSTSSRASVVFGTLFLGFLLKYISWREVTFVSAAFGLLVLWICYYFFKSATFEIKKKGEQDQNKKTDHPLNNTSLKQGLLQFTKSKRVWLVCLSLMGLTVLMEFLSFVPIYLVDSFDVSPADSAIASTIFPLGALFAVVVGGYFYDKLSARKVKILITGLLLLAVLCLILLNFLPSFGLKNSASFKISLGLIFLFGFSISPAYYLPMSVFSIKFGGIHSGVLICIIDAFGFFAAMIYAPIAGQLAETSWNMFMFLLIAISIITVVVTWMFLEYEQKAAEFI